MLCTNELLVSSLFALLVAVSSASNDTQNDTECSVSFVSVTVFVKEGVDRFAVLELQRNCGARDAMEVIVNLVSGSAQGGADFIESPVRVIFQPNSKWATVEIPIVDDSDTEENETFTATLFDNECTITIEDNDHIRPKKSAIYCTFSVCVGFEIGSETYPADSLDNVTLTVLRSGKNLDRQTQVTVTASGTATGEQDKKVIIFGSKDEQAIVEFSLCDTLNSGSTFTATLSTEDPNVELYNTVYTITF